MRVLFPLVLPIADDHFADLQLLQWWTEAFVAALVESTQRMPYAIRHLARETLGIAKVRPISSAEQFCC